MRLTHVYDVLDPFGFVKFVDKYANYNADQDNTDFTWYLFQFENYNSRLLKMGQHIGTKNAHTVRRRLEECHAFQTGCMLRSEEHERSGTGSISGYAPMGTVADKWMNCARAAYILWADIRKKGSDASCEHIFYNMKELYHYSSPEKRMIIDIED